jgi:hypothetical protein
LPLLSPGPDDQDGAPMPGIGAGAGAGAGAAAFGTALRALAFFLAAGLRAALFLFATFFLLFRAGAARFIFLVFDFDFAFDFDFDFFARLLAMIVLPIVAAQFWYGATHPPQGMHHAPSVPGCNAASAIVSEAAKIDRPFSATGSGPPVAQSINSTRWTTGIAVPAAICAMHPTLPAAITSGVNRSIFSTLRARKRSAIFD